MLGFHLSGGQKFKSKIYTSVNPYLLYVCAMFTAYEEEKNQ